MITKCKMRFSFLVIEALVLVVSLTLVNCGGGGGGGGNTVSAENSVVTAVRNSAPVSACPQGGIQVDAGIDDNSNGILDSAEVDSTQYVCNGANGSSGLTILVSMRNEPAGTNCANGGKQISAGNDANANSVLDPAEITSTDYICNGTDGPAGPGTTWVDVTGASVQAVSNTGYMANNAVSQVTITVPAAPAMGDIVQVTGIGTGGWKIAQNAGQSIITKDLPGGSGTVWTARGSARLWRSVASSSDGAKLVAVEFGGQIYTSADAGVTWTARDSAREWLSVASSSDGTKLVAVVPNGQLTSGQIYMSADSGVTWTARDSARAWCSVASSSDGAKLVAVVYGGQIYTSTDSGVTWAARDSAKNWYSVASSSDGAKLVAVVYGGQIYTSTDSGVTWTARDFAKNWYSVASSSDGAKLVAVVNSGQIYTSADSGVTWTARDSARAWTSVASSSDGAKLVAVVGLGQIYMSTDSGVTWAARDSAKNWYSVASSSDGAKLAGVVWGGQIYTSEKRTTIGTAGSISGGQYDAIALQYVGSNIFTILSHEGDLVVQ